MSCSMQHAPRTTHHQQAPCTRHHAPPPCTLHSEIYRKGSWNHLGQFIFMCLGIHFEVNENPETTLATLVNSLTSHYKLVILKLKTRGEYKKHPLHLFIRSLCKNATSTIQHAPCTQHAPGTMVFVPLSMEPAPCIMHHVPCAIFFIPTKS